MVLKREEPDPVDKSMDSVSNLADPALLQKIDKLFKCNVGHYIDLPQLVVVGDQSSGKSSVLEGLTGLAFPRNSGLCTRFATQITFRRSSEESIVVSIIPAKKTPEAEAEKLKAWKRDGPKTLDPATFTNIMTEVSNLMGIGPGGCTFSEHVLKLDLAGPSREHLSVVDVPGLFKNATEGQTTKKDIHMVRQMVLGYMQNPRSLMLCVTPANVDIATQDILDMAEEVDKKGIRTLGVLTKPDLVDEGAEQGVLDLMKGKGHKLVLGWHMVRNQGQAQLLDPNIDRNTVESSFFRDEPIWSSLDKDSVGMEALQRRLRRILTDHVRREFPKVRAELIQRLKTRRESLVLLGETRTNSHQQIQYLSKLEERYREITYQALTTAYAANDIFDQSSILKLATNVIHRNETFAEDILRRGHTYEFNSDANCGSGDEVHDDSEVQSRTSITPDGLEGILAEVFTMQSPAYDRILPWLKKVYQDSRGFELGTFQASILSNCMKLQSAEWEPIALGYISDMVSIVHSFIVQVLHEICGDERVRESLINELMDDLIKKYNSAIEQVKFILVVERNEPPATLNQQFAKEIQGRRAQRNQIQGSGQTQGFEAPDLFSDMDNTENTVQEIHDILRCYYEIARNRFVDTVTNQAAGHFLISGPDSPLKLFAPTFISMLGEERMQEIAGEDPFVTYRRAEMEKEIEDLEQGMRAL